MRRFPIGLTLSAAVAFLILLGLGAWQVQRLAWKTDLLARVEALKAAPPRALAEVLALPRDTAYRRVSVACAPPRSPTHDAFRYALRDGQVGWRLVSVCRLVDGPFDSILLDRGLVTSLNGAMAPVATLVAPPVSAIGILREPGGRPLLGPAETVSVSGARVFRVLDRAAVRSVAADSGLSRPAPYILAAESEAPAPAGVVPAALPQDIPNNHLVYALTWFALAAVLLCVYLALLLRRLKGP